MREVHPEPGRERDLHAGAVIGRDPACDLALEDPLVSRRHARLLGSELGFGIEDLDSSNGLYVNGVRVAGVTPLHPGDVFAIGGALWLVVAGESPRWPSRSTR